MIPKQRRRRRAQEAVHREAGASARRGGAFARRGGGFSRVSALVPMLVLMGACAAKGPDPAVMDSLAEMELRVRLLQSELADVRRALAESDIRSDRRADAENTIQARLDELKQSVASLPEALTGLCPAPSESSPVPVACEPEIQRVVVSGDKLVMGEVERVWIDPPAAFLVARIDASAEYSFMHAEEVVEFERDGNKWVRFGVAIDEETMSVERPLKRFVRARNERRAVVDLRVQVGDVRETVEFALGDLSSQAESVILGRNFLTDVALLDISRRNIQPAFNAPSGSGI